MKDRTKTKTKTTDSGEPRRRNLSASLYDISTGYIIAKIAEAIQRLEEHGLTGPYKGDDK